MRRLVLQLVAPLALVAFAFGATPAAADQTNNGYRITLSDCSPGQPTYEAIAGAGIGYGGLSIVGSNMQYVLETVSWTDETGFHSVSVGKATANRQLVTCHYVGPVSGNHYTTVGWFTPVGS
jgi:hypothetical protein